MSNSQYLNQVIALLIGTTVLVGGMAIVSGNFINDAKSAINGANIYQLTTALELYYFDYGFYPNVSGGDALISEITAKGYITNQPLDSNVFNYQAGNDGESYILSLN